MTLDLGDELVAGAAVAIQVPADTDFSAGDAVKWDAGNNRVEQTEAAGDDIFGIAAEDAPSTAGDLARIWISGPVVANCATGVVQGQTMDATSTAGRLDHEPDANGRNVDVDGTTDQGNFMPANPMAVTDTAGTYPYDGGNSLPANSVGVVL